MVNKLFWVLDVGFHSYIGGGCGTEDVKNCSHGLEVFIRHFVADAWNVFSLKNHIFCVAYVKDVTDSVQNPFSPHKTYVSHGPLYLNVSEYFLRFAQPIPIFEIFMLNEMFLIAIVYDVLLDFLVFDYNFFMSLGTVDSARLFQKSRAQKVITATNKTL